MMKNNKNINKDEFSDKLSQQIKEMINNSQLDSVEILSVVMESIFSLFSETEGHLAEMKFIDSAGEDYRFILRLEVPPILERQH
ncbi:hypothetical protein CQP30_06620 [Yersinia pestis]|uniref:Uncharacterized protein n=11 Tax=Yersinia pestis TaxID=632 RepID=A0AAX2I3Z5_YERPE|nr:hypothetical protein [Yersinia pestis]AAM84713.1 hypothetical [Yersinia pestis KIM10+]AAS61396.1 hypothetical protein YP_1151 [Yersinia pestis biovar Microtus str. 91001]ABG14502.1 hypothetical protein YPA_2539 [Yersinia pestis Antiqua]ABG17379.1 hypothetical protein YPN_1047 [Yersinia pestis Nepal516]ABP41051.1 hypothetical protein YPDSF_2685 [Yersinia pestis Pestoides F]